MTKLDKLKTAQIVAEIELSAYVANWKVSDPVYRLLSTEHAYFTRHVQEEREKECGLRVGNKLQLDSEYLVIFDRDNPGILGVGMFAWISGNIVEVTWVGEYRGTLQVRIRHDRLNSAVGGIGIEDAQRMRALYLSTHPE